MSESQPLTEDRRRDGEQRLDFEEWLLARKQIGHHELMSMSAREHEAVRAEYAHDTHWHGLRMKRPTVTPMQE